MHIPLASSALLALFSISSAIALPASDADLAPGQNRPCPKGVHVVAACGEGHNYDKSYSLLGTLAQDIVDQIPDSNKFRLPYPDPNSSMAHPGLTITKVGQRHLHGYLIKYVERCPRTKIVLLGYSSGAIIAMNTICGSTTPWAERMPLNPPRYADHIIATVVYGDQTRRAGLPYDLGTCTNSAPAYPRNLTAGCGTMAQRMQSYCDAGDPECCVGGIDPNAHFLYPQNYDGAATNFVVGRYQASLSS